LTRTQFVCAAIRRVENHRFVFRLGGEAESRPDRFIPSHLIGRIPMTENRILNGVQVLRGVQVQFHKPDFDRLEAYRRSQPIIPTMAATVRGLVLLGLKASAATPAKRPSAKDQAA